MSSKISALTAATALAGTEVVPAVQSSATVKATALQIANYVRGLGGQFMVFKLIGANFNSTADQAMTAVGTLPSKWRAANVIVTNASINLTTAAGGVYSAASKAGTAVVAAAQTYTACTTSTKFTSASINGSLADIFNGSTQLYLSLTTGQGATATADVYVIAQVLEP